LTDPLYPIDEPHIFLKNELVDSHNSLICDIKSDLTRVTSVAIDVVLGDVPQETKDKILRSVPKDTSKTMGLCKEFRSAYGLRNEISCNIDVDDGLANGASCVIQAVGPLDSKGRCTLLWVEFEHERIGKTTRDTNKTRYNNNVNKRWTPIFRLKRQFQVGKYQSAQVMRDQFPLRCASAKTCHRCQGDTMDTAVVDFTGRTFEHSHYVALSRVTKLENLYIRELNEKSIKISKDVADEMKRLRSKMSLFSDVPQLISSGRVFQLLFQNVRSFHKHYQDILSDHRYSELDLIIFAETKLSTADQDEDFILPQFHLYRFDSHLSQGKRSHYGLVVYSRTEIKASCLNPKNKRTTNQKCIEAVAVTLSDVIPDVPSMSVIAVYCSPGTKRQELELFLTDLVASVDHQPYVIVGDFNIDLQQHPNNTLEPTTRCPQLIQDVTTDYSTLLDHVYINGIASFRCGVMESHFSDHKGVYCVFH